VSVSDKRAVPRPPLRLGLAWLPRGVGAIPISDTIVSHLHYNVKRSDDEF
jgi:hypothetical protein